MKQNEEREEEKTDSQRTKTSKNTCIYLGLRQWIAYLCVHCVLCVKILTSLYIYIFSPFDLRKHFCNIFILHKESVLHLFFYILN